MSPTPSPSARYALDRMQLAAAADHYQRQAHSTRSHLASRLAAILRSKLDMRA